MFVSLTVAMLCLSFFLGIVASVTNQNAEGFFLCLFVLLPMIPIVLMFGNVAAGVIWLSVIITLAMFSS